MIIWTEPFLTGAVRTPSYRDSELACKTLLSLKMFAQLASTNWLFNEGFYLHSRLTANVFNTSDAPFKFFHAVGWGLSALCVLLWATSMHLFVDIGLYDRLTDIFSNQPINHTSSPNLTTTSSESGDDENDKCWAGYQHYKFAWIITGPMTLVLFVNFVFLVNIVRILVTKLRRNLTPETDQIRKAIKAVGLLFGFLGFSNFIFFFNPNDGSAWEHAYYIINALLQSSQGIVVSMLYCFTSSDVKIALAKRYYRFKVRWQSRKIGKKLLARDGTSKSFKSLDLTTIRRPYLSENGSTTAVPKITINQCSEGNLETVARTKHSTLSPQNSNRLCDKERPQSLSVISGNQVESLNLFCFECVSGTAESPESTRKVNSRASRTRSIRPPHLRKSSPFGRKFLTSTDISSAAVACSNTAQSEPSSTMNLYAVNSPCQQPPPPASPSTKSVTFEVDPATQLMISNKEGSTLQLHMASASIASVIVHKDTTVNSHRGGRCTPV